MKSPVDKFSTNWRRDFQTQLKYLRTLCRLTLLVMVGCGVYFASVFAVSKVERSVIFENTREDWARGSVIAFAFVTSELFRRGKNATDISLVRRLIVSSFLTVVSILVAHMLSRHFGLDGFPYNHPRLLPKIGIGLLVFVLLAIVMRRIFGEVNWVRPFD